MRKEGVEANGFPSCLIVEVNEHSTAVFARPSGGGHGQIGATHAAALPNQEQQMRCIEGCSDLARRRHEHNLTPQQRDRC